MAFFQRKASQFRNWWVAPSTAGDRLLSFLSGAWAGLWLGAIGRLVWGMPAQLSELFYFAVGSAALLAVLGVVFPKFVRCFAFPFIFISVPSVGS